MMVAHIILVHNKPNQLKRLLKSLENRNSKCFVHLDKKCDLRDYAFLAESSHVALVNDRQNVNWGGFSIVKAIVTSIKQVLASENRFDYINLISGQDYPLKSSQAFLTFLADNPAKIFMEFHLPGHPWLDEAKNRISQYHLTDYNFKGSTRLERILNFVLPPQKMPNDFVFIGHSGWFTLDIESAKYVIDFFENHKSFIWKFRWTWGSDEILIQSILYNSPHKGKIINNNLRYIDWTEGKQSPKVLTINDFEKLMATASFYGRKFDIDVDQSVLDHLDLAIKNEPYN